MPLSEEWWADPNTTLADILTEYEKVIDEHEEYRQQLGKIEEKITDLFEADDDSFLRIWCTRSLNGLASIVQLNPDDYEMMTKTSNLDLCMVTDGSGGVFNWEAVEKCHDILVNHELQAKVEEHIRQYRDVIQPRITLGQMRRMMEMWSEMTGVTIPKDKEDEEEVEEDN